MHTTYLRCMYTNSTTPTGKRTAIWLKIDFDIILFVDDDAKYLFHKDPPTYKYTAMIREICKILDQNFSLLDTECTDHRFTWYLLI